MTPREDHHAERKRLGPDTRLALLVALAVSIYAILVHTAVIPAHSEDRCQAITAPLIAGDSLLQIPGRVVVRIVRLTLMHTTHRRLPYGWQLAMLVNGAFYFAGTLLAARLYARLTQRHISADKDAPDAIASEPPCPITRRRFLAASTQVLGGGVVVGLGYGTVIEPRTFEITRRRIAIRDLPRSLDGLRLVQLTDLHHGPWLSSGFIRSIVEAGNRLEPDLFLLTGDYIHQATEFMKPVAQELACLRPRIGTLAVLGNHDFWEDVT
jgi:hypothetical protein